VNLIAGDSDDINHGTCSQDVFISSSIYTGYKVTLIVYFYINVSNTILI